MNFSLPLSDIWSISALYGLGRSKITEITDNGSGNDDFAIIHKGLIQVVDVQTAMRFKWGESFFITPAVGMMVHFLDNKSSYANASSAYVAVTVSYSLKK